MMDFLFHIFLAAILCQVVPAAEAMSVACIECVMNCVNKGQPPQVEHPALRDLPASGNVTFLVSFCREQRYTQISDCIDKCNARVDVCKSVTRSANSSRIASYWRELCSPESQQVFADASVCYRKLIPNFTACKRNTQDLYSHYKTKNEQHSRWDRICSVSADILRCEDSAIVIECGEKKAKLIREYNKYINLWVCPPRIRDHVHKPDLAEVLLGYQSNMESQCMTKAAKRIDQCFDYIQMFPRHTEGLTYIAEGHTHYFNNLCRKKKTFLECVEPAYFMCEEMKQYNFTKMKSSIASLCRSSKAYKTYSKTCYSLIRPLIRRTCSSRESFIGDKCRKHSSVYKCLQATVKESCGTGASSLLQQYHRARIPSGCVLQELEINSYQLQQKDNNLQLDVEQSCATTLTYTFLLKMQLFLCALIMQSR